MSADQITLWLRNRDDLWCILFRSADQRRYERRRTRLRAPNDSLLDTRGDGLLGFLRQGRCRRITGSALR